jgi:hypothetical protein
MIAPPSRPALCLPSQPSFTLGDVALILGRQRSVVRYWLTAGKLPGHRNFRGHVYVMRDDLLSFMRVYLDQ